MKGTRKVAALAAEQARPGQRPAATVTMTAALAAEQARPGQRPAATVTMTAALAAEQARPGQRPAATVTIAIAVAVALAIIAAGPAGAQVRATSARSEAAAITRRADELLAHRRHQRAARLYRRAIELDDGNLRAHLGLCASLVAAGELEPALASLARAEAIAGWTSEIGLARGVALARFGRLDDATASLERVLATGTSSADAAFELATVQLARRRWTDSITAFDRALADTAQLPAARARQARVRRAFARLQLGRNAQAERELAAVVRSSPRNVSARVLLVSAQARQGRCREALASYRAIESATERAPTILYDVALCRRRLGDRRGALAALTAYARQRRLPTAAVVLSAEIHASLGDGARAVALLWPLIERGSRDPGVLRAGASALRATGDLDRAATASERLTQVRSDAPSWALHGEIVLARGRFGDAERAFSRALGIAPANRRAATGLGRALAPLATAAMKQGDLAGAHVLLVRAHRADPAADDVACNLALLELERGDPARAIELVKDRVSARRAGPLARLLLGRAQLARGAIDPAREQLAIVADAAEAGRAIRIRALIELSRLVAAGDPDRARALADKARRLVDRSIGAGTVAAIDAVEADGRIALAERDVARGQLRAVAGALHAIDVSRLSPDQRLRVQLLELVAIGHDRGLTAAARRLDAIAEPDLAGIGAATLPAGALRHVVALYLGGWFLKRSTDFDRVLRSHAAALHDQPVAAELLIAWYDQLLARAIAAPWGALARRIARMPPERLQSPAFRHNAVIATAGAVLTPAQKRALEQVAGEVPQAAINLAVEAERQGDHAAALAQLRAIPAGQRSREVTDWIEWKERFHGQP